MESFTILLIIISFITALVLALFQYVFKAKSVGLKEWILSALRTVSLFLVFLLLINPQVERIKLFDEKPNLIVAIDNSSSMNHLGVTNQANDLLKLIRDDQELRNKFLISQYGFGNEVRNLDSLDYQDTRTDFSKLISVYKEIYKGKSAPMVVISDGNQTYGNDISYSFLPDDFKVYPVVLGDTTTYDDLRIDRINHNRYVFHRNKFEVEVFMKYVGDKSLNSKLQIYSGNSVVYSQPIQLNNGNSSKIILAELTANSIGVQNFRVEVESLENERNVINNTKEFAVEVIDQKTNVAIVYSTPHPDIGALRKSITSNDQRQVNLLKPSEYASSTEDFQLIILYQPDNTFQPILEDIFQKKLNTLVIAGRTTDWEVLNQAQDYYNQEITYQEEYYQPVLNVAYNPFIINSIDFIDYPPLISEFGTITFNTATNTALYKAINGNQTVFPLLSTLELTDVKHGVLLGEGIWRWRAQSFLDHNSFENFDNFIGKLVQYLSSNKRRKRLSISYESFYNSNDEIVLSAQFFNKSYELDNSVELYLNIKNIETDETKLLPMLNADNQYLVDLSGLSSGEYEFTISNDNEQISESGLFKVISFEIEQQFLSPDVTRLQRIADNSGGQLFYPNSISELLDSLKKDTNYVTIQKESREVSPLIDWYYLLGLIALAVSLEWFIRKYNGLI